MREQRGWARGSYRVDDVVVAVMDGNYGEKGLSDNKKKERESAIDSL